MISKFSTVYAGHVDLGDMGQAATPANERRYSNAHLASVFDKTEAIARCMDEHGYHILWLAEHHFQHEGYECIPNILMEAVHLAHVTRHLRIGCGFNITPMWHPLRLAEDFATADILTGGRTVFGVGRGYHTREVETFGSPMLDAEANRLLFEEQVDVIMKAFHSEKFSHRGKHYTLPPDVPYRGYQLRELTLVPRPLRQPVECWQPVVSASARGLDFMMKHRIKGLIGGGAATMAERSIHAYQEAAERAGVDYKLGEGLSLGIFFHIAESRERAVRGAREDVRPARLRARSHARAERRRHGPRRLGRRRRADGRALPEGRRVVRGPARGVRGAPEVARAAVPGARVRAREQQHGHAAERDARAARVVRQGGQASLRAARLTRIEPC